MSSPKLSYVDGMDLKPSTDKVSSARLSELEEDAARTGESTSARGEECANEGGWQRQWGKASDGHTSVLKMVFIRWALSMQVLTEAQKNKLQVELLHYFVWG